MLFAVNKGSFADSVWRNAIRPLGQFVLGTLGKVLGNRGEPVSTVNRPRVTGDRESDDQTRKIHEEVARIEWYHTIDLGNGIVTPGSFDHKDILSKCRLPERLDGMRVLDVATFDGYWAMEFERRGAAEVIALDIETAADLDLAPAVKARMTPADLQRRFGEGFELVHRIRNSQVQRVAMNVYDLSPENLGTFDFVFCSSLLLHLMNPVKALQNIASVTGGSARIIECYHPQVPEHFLRYEGGFEHNVWWAVGSGCLEQMVREAGFSEVRRYADIKMFDGGDVAPIWHAVFEADA